MRLTRIKSLPVLTKGGTRPVGVIHDGLFDMQSYRVTYWSVYLRQPRRCILVSAKRSRLFEDSVQLGFSDLSLLEDRAAADGLDEDTLASGTFPDILSANDPASSQPPLRGMNRVFGMLGRAFRRSIPEKPANAPPSWVWGCEVTGKPFFTSEGELGRISDVEINERDAALRQVQVSQRGGVTLHVNVESLRHIPEGKSHFVARSAFSGRSAENSPRRPIPNAGGSQPEA